MPISWKLLVQRLAIAVALFALVNVVVYHTSHYFERERSYQYSVTTVARDPNLRILFLGDSHVEQPLEIAAASLAPGVFSLANGGDSYREIFAKLRYVLKHSTSIETVFVTADPHMFGTGRMESANRSFANRYFIAATDPSGLKKGWLSSVMNEVPLFNDDYVQYLRKSLSGSVRGGQTAQADETSDADGPSGWSKLSEAERTKASTETGQEDHAGVMQHQEPFDWYQRILDLAAERKLRVIAVRFPVTYLYQAQARPEWTTAINQYLQQHGVQEIVDLRSPDFQPEDFNDPDHLSRVGTPIALHELAERTRLTLTVQK